MSRKSSKTKEQSGPTIFDKLKRIMKKKAPPFTFEEVKGESWMLCRFLSMAPNLLPIVHHVQKYYSVLGERDFVNLLMCVTPKCNAYLKYVKGRKSEVLKGLTPEIQEKLARMFFCSKGELPLVVEALVQSRIEVKELKKMFTTKVSK